MNTSRFRRPAHIAFFSGATYGHVNPFLGIVAELTRRGHRVTFCTTKDFARHVRLAGANPVLYRSMLPTDARSWPTDIQKIHLLLLRDAMKTLPDLEARYVSDRPDLVLSEDPAGAGRLMAEKWGIPAIQVWPFFAARQHWSVAADTTGLPTAARFRARLGAFLSAEGVKKPADGYLAEQTQGGIVLLPRVFQPNDGAFGEDYTFVGPCLREGELRGRWRPRDDGRPILLISLGSVNTDHPVLYRTFLNALADSSWHVVMAVGSKLDPDELGALPPNVEVHARVPQLAVLSRADLFLTHAGMSSVMEGLAHAVPLVAVPLLPEQVANAHRVEELGLGRLLPLDRTTPETVREAVARVAADQPTRDRVRTMRRAILRSGGAPAACDVIEARLAEVRLRQRQASPFTRGPGCAPAPRSDAVP